MTNLSVVDRLHEAAVPVWEECLKHPFVIGIGDGTLDVEKFHFFHAAGLKGCQIHPPLCLRASIPCVTIDQIRPINRQDYHE